MAEWSKAPDSSMCLPEIRLWVFWSTNVGVGSNPTSDKGFVSWQQHAVVFLLTTHAHARLLEVSTVFLLNMYCHG